jgi:urate oxidase
MTTSTTKDKTFVNTLVKDSYGKSVVRMTKVMRDAKPPAWKEITVETELLGDFTSCYYEGDNSKIVATDTMKNTVYVVGAKTSFNSIEEFGLTLARHYLDDYSHISQVIVRITEDVWTQIEVNGILHPTSFVKSREDNRITEIHMDRKEVKIESGIENLLVAKITDSEFSGFIKDSYTTLKETHDRIFGTKIDAKWKYKSQTSDFNNGYETARRTMLETFANHHSLSAQQTLFAMGDAVLEAIKEIDEITFVLPNLHRLPFDLKPFGQDNRNEIFVTTSEPRGTIKGTIARKK